MIRPAREAALHLAQRLWRSLPEGLRGRLGLRVGAALRDGLAQGVRAQAWSPGEPSPILVSAFFEGSTGVAAAGRATADALERAGFAVIRHNLGALLDAGGFQAHDLPGRPDGVWLIHANPPEAKLALARVRQAVWSGRYRIGYWAWELPRAPADWLNTAAGFHEVWAPSTFVLEGLVGAETILKLRPHPAPEVAGVSPDRQGFGLPPDAVVFLALADLASGFRRKNVLGAITAYKLAFPQPDARVLLVVKVHTAAADPQALAALTAAAAGRGDIRLLDERFAHARVLSLIASADVLVSLHRAEGFGLPIAEALALGTAVLATGWSGSETLLAGDEAARVPFTLQPVVDPGGPYDLPDQLWAEPDLAAAAQRMAAHAAVPVERENIAARGRLALDRLDAAWTEPALSAQPWARGVQRASPPV